MRSSLRHLVPLFLAVCALAACNQNTSGGSGSGGGSGDAGSSADAGTTTDGGGATDGGTTGGGGGGTTDGGTTGGGGSGGGGGGGGTGGGGGGTDGGTTSNDCNGLSPGALPAMVTYVQDYSSASQSCINNTMGDLNGYLATHVANEGHSSWNILTPSGTVNGSFGFWYGEAWANPVGFIGYGGSSSTQVVNVTGFTETGSQLTNTPVTGYATFASDPNGGLFAVGPFSYGSTPPPAGAHQLYMKFHSDGSVQYGPMQLNDDAAVFGVGIDTLGHTLVILDGGSGNIDAVWIDVLGGTPGSASTPLTPFRLITGFSAGAHTWFETSPLVGGGLAIRRMDTSGAPGDETRTSQWLGIVQHDARSMDSAPDWLASRPNTNMTLVRNGLAYGFSPWAANVSTCAQQVEVVAPSGASCGAMSFPVDSGACTTRELRVGKDGTVMQMLPASREQYVPGSSVVMTCTLRYWPAALR